MFTRRQTLQTLAASAGLSAFPGCTEAPALQPGRVRYIGNGIDKPTIQISGFFQNRDFTLDSPFRVASISKILVAELARRLATDGRLDMDADAGKIIAYPLRHPQFPDAVVSLRRLVSHQSGIIDPPVYWMAAPGNIRSLMTDDIWEAGVEPGASFRYSNLNYGIAATIMEAATGERFDRLFTHYIAEPLGLDIGFNWSGVSAEKRRNGFPCLRGSPGNWEIQIDGPETLNGVQPAILLEPGYNLSDYIPATNGTLFSPQGGLRASVNDLAEIGRQIIWPQPSLWEPTWEHKWGFLGELPPADDASESGYFTAFGEGVQIYPGGVSGLLTDPYNDYSWVGHHGEAYGFHGGLWVELFGLRKKAFPKPHARQIIYADLGSPNEGYPLYNLYPNMTSQTYHATNWAMNSGVRPAEIE